MPHFEPYLTFDGTCAEAMRFYEKTLGGTLRIMTFGDSPMSSQTPPGAEKRVMHAHLQVDGRALMASDTMPGMPYEGIHGAAISLSFPDVAEAKRVFTALAEGGKVQMPLEKTFWVEAFGMLVDRFGVAWLINGGASTMG